ncbi:MAG: DUF1015 domain-containing protein [Acidobacteria bacterium]|nr:DUF1015 domain-containing protein [Acidobacteriota bacterium]MBI3655814.1 DUF1015 domain-containing protein [Acidobacteriota bacterium]
MAKVFPFRALMYDPARVGDLQSVVTQPYDKITPAMQTRYYAASPYNLARIIRGKTYPDDSPGNNVYTRARQNFQQWCNESILRPAPRAAFYAYTQRYVVPGSPYAERVRYGFIGAGQLEPYSRRVIFPHERTLSEPKADRLELLDATRAHFGQIFMLYSDPQAAIDRRLAAIAAAPPALRVQDEYETTHSLWVIDDPQDIAYIQANLAEKSLLIADGHHRYETALAFRGKICSAAQAENRSLPENYNRIMMTLINMEGMGLTVLPTHRLVSGIAGFAVPSLLEKLRPHFDAQEFSFLKSDRAEVLSRFREQLRQQGAAAPAIGFYGAGREAYYILRLKVPLNLEEALPEVSERQRALDVVVLHQLILKRGLGISDEAVVRETNIAYVRELEEAIARVDQGLAQACFALNPPPIEQVRDIAFAGETLPQKSTDFYPKLLSGLTIFALDD